MLYDALVLGWLQPSECQACLSFYAVCQQVWFLSLARAHSGFPSDARARRAVSIIDDGCMLQLTLWWKCCTEPGYKSPDVCSEQWSTTVLISRPPGRWGVKFLPNLRATFVRTEITILTWRFKIFILPRGNLLFFKRSFIRRLKQNVQSVVEQFYQSLNVVGPTTCRNTGTFDGTAWSMEKKGMKQTKKKKKQGDQSVLRLVF